LTPFKIALHFTESKGKRMDATITAKGQTTIPKAIREQLGLKTGDKVRFFIGSDGRVALLPVIPISRIKGSLSTGRPPVTIEEMNEAIGAEAAGEPRS
jgi:AbrB family looped-hinge helix DNA binding protein